MKAAAVIPQHEEMVALKLATPSSSPLSLSLDEVPVVPVLLTEEDPLAMAGALLPPSSQAPRSDQQFLNSNSLSMFSDMQPSFAPNYSPRHPQPLSQLQQLFPSSSSSPPRRRQLQDLFPFSSAEPSIPVQQRPVLQCPPLKPPSSPSFSPVKQLFLPSLPLQPPSSSHVCHFETPVPQYEVGGPSRPSRSRRSPVKSKKEGKSVIVPQPYPWASTRRARVRSSNELLSKGITKIKGEVQCKRCEKQHEIELDLVEKYKAVSTYIVKNIDDMHDRAPAVWMNPVLPNCRYCGQNTCVKPLLSKKRSINWLFLFLGEMIGCCKLQELKYFCKHNKLHRTAAKDRLLYLAYTGIWEQLASNSSDSDASDHCDASESFQACEGSTIN